MSVAWICLDSDGNINEASLVEYTEPSAIHKWKMTGRNPQLVDFGDVTVTVGSPLPDGARVITT